MAKEKKFKLLKEEIMDLATGQGGCIATDRITVDGMPVGFMYREESPEPLDSGWRFFAGDEDQDYVDDPDNSSVYDINTIANYDKAIIPYLHLPIGAEMVRIEGSDSFQTIPG